MNQEPSELLQIQNYKYLEELNNLISEKIFSLL